MSDYNRSTNNSRCSLTRLSLKPKRKRAESQIRGRLQARSSLRQIRKSLSFPKKPALGALPRRIKGKMIAYLAVKRSKKMKNREESRQWVANSLQKSSKAQIFCIPKVKTSSDYHIREGAKQTRWIVKEILALICRVNRNYKGLTVGTH